VTLASFGTLCVGIVVMYFVKLYHSRMKEFDIKTLGSVLGMLFGGVVLSFINRDSASYWYYPIGLLVGLIIYIVLALTLGGKSEIVAFEREDEEIER